MKTDFSTLALKEIEKLSSTMTPKHEDIGYWFTKDPQMAGFIATGRAENVKNRFEISCRKLSEIDPTGNLVQHETLMIMPGNADAQAFIAYCRNHTGSERKILKKFLQWYQERNPEDILIENNVEIRIIRPTSQCATIH